MQSFFFAYTSVRIRTPAKVVDFRTPVCEFTRFFFSHTSVRIRIPAKAVDFYKPVFEFARQNFSNIIGIIHQNSLINETVVVFSIKKIDA